MRKGPALFFVVGVCCLASAADLATLEVKEPLGRNWSNEWLTEELALRFPRPVKAGELQLVDRESHQLPAQFYRADEKEPLAPDATLSGQVRLRGLFLASIPKNKSVRFTVRDGAPAKPDWRPVVVNRRDGAFVVSNGLYQVVFDPRRLLPFNDIPGCGIAAVEWPKGVEPSGVEDRWLERGPARSVLERTFAFDAPNLGYEITFDFRAADPWIDITESYSLGRGTFIRVGLEKLQADVVYHPHAYSARTFKAGGQTEDTTLEPPQHPIATLGPIWRDIWFGGGPFAFVYRQGAPLGIGFATVRGSEWNAPEGVSLESQSLEVHGDKEKPGQVWVKLPADGGKRRWALVVGPPELRKRMGETVRSHADLPFDMIRKEWVLDWPSKYPEHRFGMAGVWLGYFNRHELNPTTFPRRVRSHLDRLLAEGKKVKSRDLAVLAYVFMNPNYWPGPRYKWKIGNPNFHTDMYNIPLKIGLLMPDHPHAKRWLAYGVDETKGNLMRDSFPGGAWAESLSYSSFFFHVVHCAKLLRDAGVCRPFRGWPRFKQVATYLACMHTPPDPRYGERQKAPIGDTSPGNYIRQLRGMAALYRGIDDRFTEQLARFPEEWDGALDISSREFFGFGAMLRGNPYDPRHESFVTLKAGPARNHFQGDELSFHFCGLATPLAIDYACHYSPRPWSASMHNRPDMAGKRPVAIAARRAFAASPVADVFVADERTRRISHVPTEPHLTTRPGWEYPTTFLPGDKPWTMRRYAMLVKHDPRKSRIADYLVIRDEISSPEPPWWNLHVLARDIVPRGQRFFFPGQLDVDLTVHFASPKAQTFEKRQWGWSNERKRGTRKGLKGKAYEREHFGHYIPEDFHRGTWGKSFEHSGEIAKWLRVKGQPGMSRWLVFLFPHPKGRPAPEVEVLSPTAAKVTLGNESEVIHLGSEGQWQAAVVRAGKTTVLVEKCRVKPWDEIDFKPIPPGIDQGAL